MLRSLNFNISFEEQMSIDVSTVSYDFYLCSLWFIFEAPHNLTLHKSVLDGLIICIVKP